MMWTGPDVAMDLEFNVPVLTCIIYLWPTEGTISQQKISALLMHSSTSRWRWKGNTSFCHRLYLNIQRYLHFNNSEFRVCYINDTFRWRNTAWKEVWILNTHFQIMHEEVGGLRWKWLSENTSFWFDCWQSSSQIWCPVTYVYICTNTVLSECSLSLINVS